MDKNKISSSLTNKVFTDLELTLKDPYGFLKIINVHKIILWLNSSYFEKLLTSCKEATMDKITIEVPNVEIAHNIIMSFYDKLTPKTKEAKKDLSGYPHYQYLFDQIKCHDFFDVEFDTSFIYTINIPSEAFESLLEILPLLDDNKRTYDLLRSVMPKNYDKLKLSDELLRKLHYNVIATGTDDGINLWDIEYGHTREFEDYLDPSPIDCMCSSTDGFIMATGHYGGLIKIWNQSSAPSVYQFYSNGGYINSLCFLFNNIEVLVSGGSCETSDNIIVWGICGNIINAMSHKSNVNHVSVSHDNKYIISSGDDGLIKMWAFDKGNLVKTFKGHTGKINRAYFTNDDKIIISVSDDKTIKLWNVDNGQMIKTISEHQNNVTSLYLSHDNTFFVTSSLDQTIKIWKMNGDLIKSIISDETLEIDDISITFDNRYIVTHSRSGHKNIKVLDIESEQVTNEYHGDCFCLVNDN